jgi:hypothetical protein
MKSPFGFIVEPIGGRYRNTTDIGGTEFIRSISVEDHKATTREALVLETPLRYKGPIKIGDKLLVHHNVFRQYYDLKQGKSSSNAYFFNDKFIVGSEEFFAYHDGNDWNAVDRYCLVKPIEEENKVLQFDTFQKEKALVVEMAYPNKYLSSKSILKLDKVVCKPDSKYEFVIDGEVYYRMYDHQIVAKWM